MIPTKLFAVLWSVLLGLTLYPSVFIITTTSLASTEAHPLINSRTRTGQFERNRPHARRHKHRNLVVSTLTSSIDEFPLVCSEGKVRGHDGKCHFKWR